MHEYLDTCTVYSVPLKCTPLWTDIRRLVESLPADIPYIRSPATLRDLYTPTCCVSLVILFNFGLRYHSQRPWRLRFRMYTCTLYTCTPKLYPHGSECQDTCQTRSRPALGEPGGFEVLETASLARATGTRTPNSGARNRCVANYTIALCRLERAEYTQGAPGCQEIFLPFLCFLQFSGGGWRRRLRRSGVHPARRRRCRRRNLHLPRRGKALPNPGFAGFLHCAGYARESWCVSRSR